MCITIYISVIYPTISELLYLGLLYILENDMLYLIT